MSETEVSLTAVPRADYRGLLSRALERLLRWWHAWCIQRRDLYPRQSPYAEIKVQMITMFVAIITAATATAIITTSFTSFTTTTTTTTWKISTPPTISRQLRARHAPRHRHPTAPLRLPVKEGTRAATIVHSQPPARRGSIVSVAFVSGSTDRKSQKKRGQLIFITPVITCGSTSVPRRQQRGAMNTNATSGLSFSIYLFVGLLMVLACGSEGMDKDRGCSVFGHACFGGHGKRFDPLARRVSQQVSNNLQSQDPQELEMSSPDDDLRFILPNNKLREDTFVPARRNAQLLDPYPLSSLVDQWLEMHRRPHRTDMEVIDK